MEWFSFFYYFSLFLTTIVGYFIIFKKRNNSDFRWNKDWFYHIKFHAAQKVVAKYQQKYKEKVETIGEDFETTINVFSVEDSNSQIFCGVDQQGNSLFIHFVLRTDDIVELRLYLRLADGNSYTLPGGKNLLQSNLAKKVWRIKGLNIEILEPFVRLRITFNGLLLNIGSDKTKHGNIEHIQFSFIFTAVASPTYFPQETDKNLVADSLASDNWNDGSWKENLVDQYGYEQFGTLTGFVRGDSYSEKYVLNLPACRGKSWGIDDRISLKKALRLFIVDEYGNLIWIVLKSLKNGVSQMNHGCVFQSDNKRMLLKGIDIKLKDIGKYEILPEMITAQITIPGKTLKCVINLNKPKSIKSTNDWEYVGFQYYNIPATCNIDINQATAIVELWYKIQGKAVFIPKHKIIENTAKYSMNTMVTNIKSDESRILDLAGGKGASLALLASLKSKDVHFIKRLFEVNMQKRELLITGFRSSGINGTKKFIVPEGCIVTTNAYKLQFHSNPDLEKFIYAVNDICCGKADGDLEAACQQVMDCFKYTNLSPVVAKAITQFLSDNNDDSHNAWAVRSSAVGEDSEDMSAAGQNETFLGCLNVDQVLSSVSACWASLFSSQSVRYRWQHGLPVVSDMAVVIQRMVPADSAGVLFTWHPATSSPSQMVITSNFGIGETVVSGGTDPDTFTINRTWDDQISILEKFKGMKNKVLKMVDSGLQEVRENGENWSLTDKQALYLAQIGVVLEEAFGNPRDIEWAYYNDQLYLLQSRPITTLNGWTDFELTHEMDYPLTTNNSVFTVANIKEVIPKGATVLSQTSSMLSLDRSIQIFALENYDPISRKGCPVFYHNLFLDVINGIHRNATNKIQVSSLILDLTIFGHPVLEEKINNITLKRRGPVGMGILWQTLRILICAWQNKEIIKYAESKAYNLDLNFQKDESLKQIVSKIEHALEDLVEITTCHSKTTSVCVFYQIFAMNLLLEGGKELSVDHYHDFAIILSSCEDVISAEVPLYIEQLAEIIRKKGHANEFCQINPEDGIDWLTNNCFDALVILRQFLDRHGHRSTNEFEIMETCWADNPSSIISMIQVNVKHGKISAKKKLSVEEIIQQLVSPKSSITRRIIKFIIQKMRIAVGRREKTKSEVVRTINKLREAYRFLASEMVSLGIIPSSDLIYHLTHHELKQLTRKRNPLLITKAMRRQKFYSDWQKLRFPEISYGAVVPIQESTIKIKTSTKVVKGTPASSGITTARACVLDNIGEIHQLQKGDILITYSTDIAWSPYFPMLSGIVTELGGLVSHGAVVAREYGLPCIVGVQEARKYFKTGDILLMDGTKGEIKIVTN